MKTVEDILAVRGPSVITAPSTSTVKEAAKLMTEANVGSVVIREGREVQGIFTERDLLSRVVACGKDPSLVTLAEVMSAPVEACGLSDSVDECAARLTEGHIRHLIVVEDGALVGLISFRDMFSARDLDVPEGVPTGHASTANDYG